MKIRVECDTKLRIPHHELHEIQGDLKEMSKEDYEKLKKTLIADGIDFAFHVWNEARGTAHPPGGSFAMGTEGIRQLPR